MARDLNRCEFIGRLGQDPEIKYTSSGAAVANISIAIGKTWIDKTTNEKQEHTEWVRVVAFNKTAEIIGEYLKKGSKVFVAGEMRTRKWQAQDGTDKWTTEIVCNELIMLDSKPSGDSSQARADQQASAYQQPPQQHGASHDAVPDGSFDDLPF